MCSINRAASQSCLSSRIVATRFDPAKIDLGLGFCFGTGLLAEWFERCAALWTRLSRWSGLGFFGFLRFVVLTVQSESVLGSAHNVSVLQSFPTLLLQSGLPHPTWQVSSCSKCLHPTEHTAFTLARSAPSKSMSFGLDQAYSRSCVSCVHVE